MIATTDYNVCDSTDNNSITIPKDSCAGTFLTIVEEFHDILDGFRDFKLPVYNEYVDTKQYLPAKAKIKTRRWFSPHIRCKSRASWTGKNFRRIK